jgi:3-methyladenine DNA glycosylase AlkC
LAEELRNIYNEEFVTKLGNAIKMVYSPFETKEFHVFVFQPDWSELTLKERMRRITESMHKTLPNDYSAAIKILYQVAPKFPGLAGIIFPDYVDQYGLDNWDQSMEALAFFTPYSTSEFAVRPFLSKEQDKMLKQMIEWSKHSDEHIRRLASEGSRPRLPWGYSIPSLKKNPEVALPILTNLKQDDSLYVRKSVANHLNDISYSHPELVLYLASEWLGKNKHTDWIIKHACRSMLKKGNSRALALFGFKDDKSIEVRHFSLDKKWVSIGDSIQFDFTLFSKNTMPVRAEYSIDYVKANGQRSKKVFMISSFEMKENDTRTFEKKQSFKDLTIRKHYRGIHTISIIVNGSVKASLDFEVV